MSAKEFNETSKKGIRVERKGIELVFYFTGRKIHRE